MATPESLEEKAERLLSPVVTRLRNYVSKQKEDYASDFIDFRVTQYREGLMNPVAPPGPNQDPIPPMPAEQAYEAAEAYRATLVDTSDAFDEASITTVEVGQYIREFFREVEKEYFRNTGYPLDQNSQNILKTYAVKNLMVPDDSKISLENHLISQGIFPFESWEVERMGTDQGPISPLIPLKNYIDIALSDKEDNFIRWPNLFTKDKQLGAVAKQLDQAGVITTADRESDSLVMQNLDRHWDTIKRQLDDVSSENEKNFANVADKLVNAATDDDSTPAGRTKKAEFGWLEDIANPNMQSPENFKSAYQVMGSENVTELVENPGKLLEEQIKELFKDDLLTDAQKTERNRIIAEGQLTLLSQKNAMGRLGWDDAGMGEAGMNQAHIDHIVGTVSDRLQEAKAQADAKKAQEEYATNQASADAITSAQGVTQAENWVRTRFGSKVDGTDLDTDISKDLKSKMADEWVWASQQMILNGLGPPPLDSVFGQFIPDLMGGGMDQAVAEQAIENPDLMSNPVIHAKTSASGYGMTPSGEVAEFGTYIDPRTGDRIGGATYIDPNTGQIAVDAYGNPVKLSGQDLLNAALDPNSPIDWLTRASTITAATASPGYIANMGKQGAPPSPPAHWFEGQVADMSGLYPYAKDTTWDTGADYNPMIWEMGPPGSGRKQSRLRDSDLYVEPEPILSPPPNEKVDVYEHEEQLGR